MILIEIVKKMFFHTQGTTHQICRTIPGKRRLMCLGSKAFSLRIENR